MSVILIAFASCLTVAEGQESKMQSETIAQSNFTTDRAYDYSYCHGGYGVEGEEEGKSAGKNLVVKNSISETGGKPDHCLTATLDTTKIEIPGGASYNYVLWSAGSAMDLATPFKSTDLEGYSVSFDAKISGTESLPSSKLFFNFLVEDDVVAKDDDQNEDIVLSLTRGDDDKGGLIELTNEYQHLLSNSKATCLPTRVQSKTLQNSTPNGSHLLCKPKALWRTLEKTLTMCFTWTTSN